MCLSPSAPQCSWMGGKWDFSSLKPVRFGLTRVNSYRELMRWRLRWTDLQEDINFHQALPLLMSLSTPPLRLKYLCEDDKHL